MPTTVEIPGGKAEILTLKEITVRQRRMVQATFMTTGHIYSQIPREILEASSEHNAKGLEAQQKINLMVASMRLPREDCEALLGLQDSAIVAFTASWTLDQPLPTLDNVQDLSPELYDALALATAGVAAQLATGNSFEPTPNTEDNQETPFVGSETSNSDSSSPTKKSSKSIPKLQSVGASTSTDPSTE